MRVCTQYCMLYGLSFVLDNGRPPSISLQLGLFLSWMPVDGWQVSQLYAVYLVIYLVLM